MRPIITAERADASDAVALIEELEEHLASLYPSESRHGYSVEKLLRLGILFFVLRDAGVPAGCGGIQIFSSEYGELKRMYVRPQFRGRGYGMLLLEHLIEVARQRGIGTIRLETGIHQREAIALYERAGFNQIPPFGEYRADPLSRCYEKRILIDGGSRSPPEITTRD